MAVLAGLFLLFVVIAVATDKTPPEVKAAKAHDRDVIALCREDQNDELKDLSTRRFIRATCDKLESDFRARYGVAP